MSIASLDGAFTLGFIGLAIGIAYLAAASSSPPLTGAFAQTVCEATFLVSVAFAIGLALLLAGGPLFATPRPSVQGLRVLRGSPTAGRRILVGPLVTSLILVAVSGSVFIGAQSTATYSSGLVLDLSLYFLGAWGLYGAWIVTILVLLLRSRPRGTRVTESRADEPPVLADRPWLRPLPAIVIAAVILALVAYPAPSAHGWQLDGNMSKWATVPGHQNPSPPLTLGASGPTLRLEYPVPGVYNATLNVTDSTGLSGSVITQFRVPNLPPIPKFAATVNGLNLSVNGTLSSDPDGSVASYAWVFGDGGSGSGPEVSHTYYASGTYNVTLIVTDHEGSSASRTLAVTVHGPNRSPLARATYTLVNYRLQVFGGTSFDPDGSIVSYNWSFGDGGSALTADAVHSYVTNGTFRVNLIVEDNEGATNVTQFDIAVPHPLPVARFTVAPTGLYAVFNASMSTADGPIVAFSWNFGDTSTGSGVVAGHQYRAAGAFDAVLTVLDASGASGTATHQVNLTYPPDWSGGPVARFVYSTSGLFATFQNTGSYSPSGALVSSFWDFGDGSTAQGDAVDHLFSDAGPYTVRLTVVDDLGQSGAISALIAIQAPPPNASPPNPRISLTIVNFTVTLEGSASTAVGVTVARFLWTLDFPSAGLHLVDVKAHRESGQLFLYARVDGAMFPFASIMSSLTFFFDVAGQAAGLQVAGMNAGYALRISGLSGQVVSAQLLAFLPSGLQGAPPAWFVIGTARWALNATALESMVPTSALLASYASTIRVTCATELIGSVADALAQPFSV